MGLLQSFQEQNYPKMPYNPWCKLGFDSVRLGIFPWILSHDQIRHLYTTHQQFIYQCWSIILFHMLVFKRKSSMNDPCGLKKKNILGNTTFAVGGSSHGKSRWGWLQRGPLVNLAPVGNWKGYEENITHWKCHHYLYIYITLQIMFESIPLGSWLTFWEW